MAKSKHDYSKLIIWAALIVTVTRYIGAFVASDLGEITGWVSDLLTILMGVSGVGMGFLDVLGLAYVFDGWRANLPKAGQHVSIRFQFLTGFVVGLFVVGLAILTPFTVSRVNGEGMSATLGGGVWWWSLAVNLAPILLIGGVTFSQTGFVTVAKDTPASEPHMQASSMHNASISQSDALSPLFICKHCDMAFNTIPELASHTRWKHPQVNGKVLHTNGRG